MKSIFLSLLLLVSVAAHSQKIAVLFYDSDWKITTREQSSFYRTCLVDTANLKFYGGVKDHYKNGKLHMSGTYSNNIKIDSFYFYHPNGRLESKGLYVDNLRTGIWRYYHPNGKLKQVIEFLPTDYRLKEYYDSLGNALLQNGTGAWHNEYKLPGAGMTLRIEGEYKNWKRDGKWKTYSRYGDGEEKLDHTDKYDEEVLTTPWYSGSRQSAYLPEHRKFETTERFHYSFYVTRKNFPLIKTLPLEIDSLMLPYDVNASFPGGEDQMSSYIRRHLKSPRAARASGAETFLLTQFVIDKNGRVTNIKVTDHRYPKDE
jgi:hypothetical protein